jgi:dTDP-glucose 4,6-dehydratase
VSNRILVTGAAGFLGHHMVEYLLKSTDWEVVGLASFRHQGCPARLRHVIGDERFTLVQTELGAPLGPRVTHEIGEVDFVVNFAAESHVDRSIETPRPFVVNNVEVALTMLEFAREIRPRHFVQFSTDEVYGAAPEGYAHREWDPIIPSNPYSASKAAQEAIAVSYWRTYGVRLSIVNSMNLIGERQTPEKLVPVVIRAVLNGGEVPIFGTSADRVGYRMYLHARNLADALLFLLQREPVVYPAADRPDRWNVVGERETSNLEMAQLIAAILERPLRHRLIPEAHARPGHDWRYALDGAKLEAAGWKQPMDFEESLARTVRWTAEHTEWLA